MSPVIDTTFKAAKICRRYSRYIVMGGPHVSIFKDAVFSQCSEIDFAVYGEGEITFLELIKRLEGNEGLQAVQARLQAAVAN